MDPKSGFGRTSAPCPSGAMVTHYEGDFITQKLKCILPIAIWYALRPPKLTLWSRRPKRGARWGSGASAVHFGGNFIKQKLLGTPDLVGVGHLIGPQIRIWKDLGLVCRGPALSNRVYKIKLVICVPNRYFIPIVHAIRDRALAWRDLQGPGRAMSGYPKMLELIIIT